MFSFNGLLEAQPVTSREEHIAYTPTSCAAEEYIRYLLDNATDPLYIGITLEALITNQVVMCLHGIEKIHPGTVRIYEGTPIEICERGQLSRCNQQHYA